MALLNPLELLVEQMCLFDSSLPLQTVITTAIPAEHRFDTSPRADVFILKTHLAHRCVVAICLQAKAF